MRISIAIAFILTWVYMNYIEPKENGLTTESRALKFIGIVILAFLMIMTAYCIFSMVMGLCGWAFLDNPDLDRFYIKEYGQY